MKIHREWMAVLNPVALEEGREQRKMDIEKRRAKQQREALIFLTTGKSQGIPPYPSHGKKEWNREYNPWTYQPHPEKPDPDLYMGTGIGAIYGMDGCERHMWQLAGWNLTRRHPEVTPGGSKKY